MFEDKGFISKSKIRGTTYFTESIKTEQICQEQVKNKLEKLILNNINTHEFIELNP